MKNAATVASSPRRALRSASGVEPSEAPAGSGCAPPAGERASALAEDFAEGTSIRAAKRSFQLALRRADRPTRTAALPSARNGAPATCDLRRSSETVTDGVGAVVRGAAGSE